LVRATQDIALSFRGTRLHREHARLHQETQKATLDRREDLLESDDGVGSLRRREEVFARRNNPRPFPHKLLEDFIGRRLASIPSPEVRNATLWRKGCVRPIGQSSVEPRAIHVWSDGVLRRMVSAGNHTEFAGRALARLGKHMSEVVLCPNTSCSYEMYFTIPLSAKIAFEQALNCNGCDLLFFIS
jgi:hypothetical protein